MKLSDCLRGFGEYRPPHIVWGLGALLAVLTSSEAAAQTPAGTVIENWARVSYETANGAQYEAFSDTVAVVVGQVAGMDLEPSLQSVADPGDTVVFNHVLSNISNGPDQFDIVVNSTRGWTINVYRPFQAGRELEMRPLNGPVALQAGYSADLVVEVIVPEGREVRGMLDSLDVVATSIFDPAVSDRVDDEITVRDAGIAIALDKSVDRDAATKGDVLTYRITYTATGPASATNLVISDTIPLGSSYIPGTMTLDDQGLTDRSGDDAGSFDLAGNAVAFTIATVNGGDTGTVSFQVRVN